MSRTSQVTVHRRSRVPQLIDRLERLRKTQVYVGIPRDHTRRQDEKGINNATLLKILTNGSPAANLPATPIVEPAIEKDRAIFAPELKLAADALLHDDPTAVTQHLKRVGTLAVNSVKRYFTDPANAWPPNAPSTIKRKGSDRRNIDTSQLRRAMTYVLREGDRITEPQSPEE